MVKVRLDSALREHNEGSQSTLKNVLENVPKNKTHLSDRQKNIIMKMKETGRMNVLKNVLENFNETSSLLAAFFHVNERTIRRDLQYLQSQGIIRRVGADKGGHWEVLLDVDAI